MSKDQEYYDGLLIKGYTETQALQYTTQYYPEFTVVQAPQPVEQSNPYLPNIDSIETTMLDSSQLAGAEHYVQIKPAKKYVHISKNGID